ncbi:MAG: hypothetical protein AB8F94_15890 [Saprospiraceae bacterium]
MKFNQISDKFPIENKDIFFWNLIGAIGITIILIFIQKKIQFSKIMLIPIVLIGVFILRRSRRLLSDWTKNKHYIGELEFKAEIIYFDKGSNQIKVSEIEYIYFRYNFIKGRNFAPRDIIHNGLAELNLTTKNGKDKTLKFVIETKEQFEYLKSIFKNWYQQGIEIREEFTNQKLKTICLDVIGNKSFKEIQELKSQIKKNEKSNFTNH